MIWEEQYILGKSITQRDTEKTPRYTEKEFLSSCFNLCVTPSFLRGPPWNIFFFTFLVKSITQRDTEKSLRYTEKEF